MRRLETPQLNIEDTPILAPDGSLRGGAQRLLTCAQIFCDRDSERERGGPFSGLRKHDRFPALRIPCGDADRL